MNEKRLELQRERLENEKKAFVEQLHRAQAAHSKKREQEAPAAMPYMKKQKVPLASLLQEALSQPSAVESSCSASVQARSSSCRVPAETSSSSSSSVRFGLRAASSSSSGKASDAHNATFTSTDDVDVEEDGDAMQGFIDLLRVKFPGLR
ncbi:unnamed protein product, partial [Amoebophrya sp. A25]